MGDNLVSLDRRRVLSYLLFLDASIIYSRYDELLKLYKQRNDYRAVIVLQLVCWISGYKVELPNITPDNYVRFDTNSTSDDIKISIDRLVRVNALQVYLVTRSITNAELAKRYVDMHILASHMAEHQHYIKEGDYKAFPSIIRMLKLYELNPDVTANMIATGL